MMSRLDAVLAIALLPVVLLAGCSSSDDPTGPGQDPWIEETLPAGFTGAGLLAIDAHGDFVIATGVRVRGASLTAFVLERTPSGWREMELTGLPPGTILTDVAAVGDNEFVLVGGTADGDAVVVDVRNRIHIQTFSGTSGVALNAVAAGGGLVRAVGFGNGGFAVVSTGPGAWELDALPFADLAEKGFRDLEYHDGRFLACGFDDGGEPFRLVLVHDGFTWAPVAVPAGNRDLNAILGTDSGGFFVGGQQVQEDLDAAFLLGHSPDPFDWFEIVLPEPATLGSVNDILRDGDGTLWLACGAGGSGGLVGGGVIVTTLQGRLTALADDGNGTLYAAGVTGTNDADARPTVLRRR